MSTTSQIGVLVRIGILAGFAGLGILGLALIGMAITLSAGAAERVVVLLLGIGALVIAIEAVPLMAGRSQ